MPVSALATFLPLLPAIACGCHVSYHSSTAGDGALGVGEPVVFVGAGAVGPNQVYTFTFLHSDGGDCIPPVSTDTGVVSQRFGRPGGYQASLRCSSGPSIDSTYDAAAQVEFIITASAAQDCYVYRVHKLHQLTEGAGPEFAISVWDRADWSHIRSTQVSSQFVQLGATPRIRLTSLRKIATLDPHPSTSRTGWTLTLPASWATDVALQIEVFPPASGTALLGCTVAATTVHVSRRQRALPFAAGSGTHGGSSSDASTSTSSDVIVVCNTTTELPRPALPVGDGGAVAATSFSPALALSVHQHACRPSELSLVLRPTITTATTPQSTTSFQLLLSNNLIPTASRVEDQEKGEHGGSYHHIHDMVAWVCSEVGYPPHTSNAFGEDTQSGNAFGECPLLRMNTSAVAAGGMQLLEVLPLLTSYRTELLLVMRRSGGDTPEVRLYHFLAAAPPLHAPVGRLSSAHAAPVLQPAELRPLTTLSHGAAHSAAQVTDAHMSVSVPQPCAELAPSTSHACVFLILQRQIATDSSPGSSFTEVYHRCGDLQLPWRRQAFNTESLPDLGRSPVLCPGWDKSPETECEWRVLSAVRDQQRGRPVYLLQSHSVSSNVGDSFILVGPESSGGETSGGVDGSSTPGLLPLELGFAHFRSGTQNSTGVGGVVISSLIEHVNGYELLAYGARELWRSSDGGHTFQLLCTLPSGSGTVDQVATTTFHSGYAILTAGVHRRVFYGRTGVSHVAEILSPLAALPSAYRPLLFFSSEAELLLSDVAIAITVSPSTGADNGGSPSEVQVGNPVVLPVSASIRSDDNALAVTQHSPHDNNTQDDGGTLGSAWCNLVPSWDSGGIIVACSGGSAAGCESRACFAPQHVGREIVFTPRGSGTIRIVQIRGGLASGVIIGANLGYERRGRGKLTLQKRPGSAAATTTVSDTSNTSDTSTAFPNSNTKVLPGCEDSSWLAVLSGPSVGNSSREQEAWAYADIGKTILTTGAWLHERRSYVVEHVLNVTHAVVTLYFGGHRTANGDGSSSGMCRDGSSIPGLTTASWRLYDFRAWDQGRRATTGNLWLSPVGPNSGTSSSESTLRFEVSTELPVDEATRLSWNTSGSASSSSSWGADEDVAMGAAEPLLVVAGAYTHMALALAHGPVLWGLITPSPNSSNSSSSFIVSIASTALSSMNFSNSSDSPVQVKDWSAFRATSVPVAAAHSRQPALLGRERRWRVLAPACSSIPGGVDLWFQERGRCLGTLVRYVDAGQEVVLRGSWAPPRPPTAAVLGYVAGPPSFLASMDELEVRLAVFQHGMLSAWVDKVDSALPPRLDGTTPISRAPNVSLTAVDSLRRRSYSVRLQTTRSGFGLLTSGGASLACEADMHSLLMLPGCAPGTRLALATNSLQEIERLRDHTTRSKVAGTASTAAETEELRWHTLRRNYRPPSDLGRAVPTSPNIYNADPSLPRDAYYEYYSISRNTGALGQCAGVQDRTECRCPASVAYTREILSQQEQPPFFDARGGEEQLSPLEFSDCVGVVPAVHFTDQYLPELWIIDGASLVAGSGTDNARPARARRFQGQYTLTELNGRSDYCVSDFAGDCANKFAVTAHVLTATDGHESSGSSSGLVWEAGELFHFRVTVVELSTVPADGDGQPRQVQSLCELSTEVVVYVDNLTMQLDMQYLVMASTVICCLLGILAVYIYHFQLLTSKGAGEKSGWMQ